MYLVGELQVQIGVLYMESGLSSVYSALAPDELDR